MNNKRLTLYILPLIISSLIIFLASDTELWKNFWPVFNVPPQLPPFSDLDSISRALGAKSHGLNPYFDNPYDLSQKPYSYTSIWLTLFEFFRLNDQFNFRVFNFILIYSYIFIFIKLALKINSNIFSIFLIVSFFSTSNLLLLERLNIEIMIIILVFLISVIKNDFLKIPIYFSAIFLKLYPIFSVFIFMKNKKLFFLIIFLSLLSLIFIKDQIYLIIKNAVEYALIIVHGFPSIIKGISYYAIRNDLFINENNYLNFKFLSIFIAIIYTSIIFFYNFRLGEKNLKREFSLEEKLFVCGAGIYVGKMLFFSNWDYGLVFLIFTIPYIIRLNNNYKYIYLLIVLVCMNSFYFEGGDRYTIFYASKAFVVHSLKILIFSYLCFYFSKIINIHLEIKFKNE